MRWLALCGLVAACGAQAPSPAPPGEPRTEQLAVRSETSFIRFAAARVGAKHIGELRRFTGTITLVGGDVAGSRIIVDIDMRSLVTDVPALTAHLSSPDFFDVARYPNAVFASTTVAPGQAEGTLELRGRRQTLRFPVTVELRPDLVTASGSFHLDRRAFGINHPGIPWDRASDEVDVSFHIEAPR